MPKQKQKLTARQKESKRINRQRAMRQLIKTSARRSAICGLALFPLCAGWLWWHSGMAEKIAINTSNNLWQETAKLGFKVENIYLEGRNYTSVADITKAMNLTAGEPILNVSLNDMRVRLESIPRIKSAEVTRVLPDQLHVRVIEREPIAIWQDNGKLHLIDEDGVAMEYIDPAQYKDLLLAVGDDAPAHMHEILSLIASEPELYKNVAAVQRVGDRRWNVRFKNGIELKLPEKNASQAWQSFANIEHENHILERAIKSVDMRLPDKIYIKSTPAEATPVKVVGSET